MLLQGLDYEGKELGNLLSYTLVPYYRACFHYLYPINYFLTRRKSFQKYYIRRQDIVV